MSNKPPDRPYVIGINGEKIYMPNPLDKQTIDFLKRDMDRAFADYLQFMPEKEKPKALDRSKTGRDVFSLYDILRSMPDRKSYAGMEIESITADEIETMQAMIPPGIWNHPKTNEWLKKRSNPLPEFNLVEGKPKVAIYNIRIESLFVLTQNQVKQALGHGYKVTSVEVDKGIKPKAISSIDNAVENIITAGYRALARAHHPDLGGDVNTMMLINKAKKELEELLASVKEI